MNKPSYIDTEEFKAKVRLLQVGTYLLELERGLSDLVKQVFKRR